jgi:hypothetical protein
MRTTSRRLALVLMTLTLVVVSGCSSRDVTPEECDPDPLRTGGEVSVPAEGFEVWALLFATYHMTIGQPVFIPQDEEIKIVWRVTGEGDVSVQALGPDGSTLPPVWGPEGHIGSNWDRPGDEWGTGWVFPEPGCWSIEVERGDAVAYMDVDIRA